MVNLAWWGMGYKQKDTIRAFDIWCKLAQNSKLEARRFIEKKRKLKNWKLSWNHKFWAISK